MTAKRLPSVLKVNVAALVAAGTGVRARRCDGNCSAGKGYSLPGRMEEALQDAGWFRARSPPLTTQKQILRPSTNLCSVKAWQERTATVVAFSRYTSLGL